MAKTDTPWVVCYHKENEKGYTPVATPETAAHMAQELESHGFDASIIFQTEEARNNFLLDMPTNQYLIEDDEVAIERALDFDATPADNRSIFELMGEMNQLAADIFEPGKSTVDFLKEEAEKKN